MACDMLAARLAGHALFAIDCGGDLRFGGAAGGTREVRVEHPFDGGVAWAGELSACAIATSGTLRRRWPGGHHLIDPATGRPARTGLVQATAFAPTGLEAEVRAKAALLSGPGGAPSWLAYGGVLIGEDGGVEVVGAVDARAAA
jgi:thiamine biosynthesis lipoprotein